jgi:hypothetical protein
MKMQAKEQRKVNRNDPNSPMFFSYVGEIFCESNKTRVKIFWGQKGAV